MKVLQTMFEAVRSKSNKNGTAIIRNFMSPKGLKSMNKNWQVLKQSLIGFTIYNFYVSVSTAHFDFNPAKV